MYPVTPEEIADNEPLTHALFYPDDVNKSTFWVKYKAFIPPPRSPYDVSFNRACYLPDHAQKALAKKIKRRGEPRCFLRMTVEKLKNALIQLADTRKVEDKPAFEETAYFKYTPLFDPDNPEEWPDNVEKKWGNGFNPAHVDLYYSRPYIKGEANEFVLLLSKAITAKENVYCEVICEREENFDQDSWSGEKLCNGDAS